MHAHARTRIENRGRDNYRDAAALLKTVRQLHIELGERPTWETLINSIKAEFKQLRALQDELRQAGL